MLICNNFPAHAPGQRLMPSAITAAPYFLRVSPCDRITTRHSGLQLYLAAQISRLCVSPLLRIVLPLDDQNGGSARAFSLTALVAQRDVGTGTRGRSGQPHLAAPRRTERRPASPRRARARPGFRRSPRCVVTGDQLRRHDDGPRAACTCGRRCQRHGNPEDPVGGIMPDHVGDRGAVRLDPAALFKTRFPGPVFA